MTLDQLLTPEINKPARYLGNELGAVHKPWEKATVRWVLTYPEVYEVGASNLGHIILYNILNAQPAQLCDRAYLPAPDLAAKLRTTQTPLFALEARRPVTDFDVLGFSLSYELGMTNILEMLDLAQIPLTAAERLERPDLPLIFAGGQTATSNPEPFAEFFDFFALGDGEELLPEIGLVIAEGKAAGLSKRALLLDLAQVPGVYVPLFYDMAPDGSVHPNHPDVPPRILRRVANPMPEYSIGLVPYVETVHDRLTVEIRRGCTRGCRFCQPGMLTRPARDVEPEQVINAIEAGMRATGHNEFSLLSLSCSDYLALPAVGMEIKNRLKDENVSLALPSQRVDRFDENIANILGGTRQMSLTFAPEAGTQRLRDVINKGLTNEELLRGVKTAVEQGWDKVKLYFMIGLPGETDVDVLGIAETMRWLRQECVVQGRKRLDFNVTISNFTPKPHTPFQWHSVSTAEFTRKKELLWGEFKQMRGIKANFTDVRISAMEDFVGRGDRRLAPVIRKAWELGAGMDAWWDNLDRAFGAWGEAIAASDLTWKYRQIEEGEWNVMAVENEAIGNVENLRAASPQWKNRFSWDERLNAALPWDHINTGIDKEWLKADLQRALAETVVPDCAFEGCSQCGICGDDFGHNIVQDVPPIPAFAGQFEANQTRAQRWRLRFGKLGELRFLGHLDLVRLFDRLTRRASLPIAFTGGFHPGPRIAIANALSLGMTSSGEIVDFELTEPLEFEDFKGRLLRTLPPDLPLYDLELVDVQAPSANKLLEAAEYTLTLTTESPDPQWERWVSAVWATPEIWFEKKTKSGKLKSVNLRDRLLALTLIETEGATAKIHYRGQCRNDGTVLQPEHCVYLLSQVSEETIQLAHGHRERLILA
ncbi:TIGR03960 family B12-binding radical SAM protein [Spirulina sp. CCNP1310]|uniref:TIGR03960 family B12-binding radical SAM protein n=1 Tax=Spirulina sp. CCNP1310 TaxID=3110249 RepID=UPI002B20552C|nr:TIGR03960 family B12-binding radical SAM protein [Spirulina sp. CCNP1310]MEA5419996.1 TIGR03960 family B12-binding radical SAM protein [Spirulina sp. CCNP1310]